MQVQVKGPCRMPSMHVGFVSDNASAATSAHTLKFLGQITHVGACDSQDEWMSVPSLPFCVSLPSQPNTSFLRGSLTMPGLCGEGFALRKTPLTPATGGHARCLAACLLFTAFSSSFFIAWQKKTSDHTHLRECHPCTMPVAELSIAACLQHI